MYFYTPLTSTLAQRTKVSKAEVSKPSSRMPVSFQSAVRPRGVQPVESSSLELLRAMQITDEPRLVDH